MCANRISIYMHLGPYIVYEYTVYYFLLFISAENNVVVFSHFNVGSIIPTVLWDASLAP